MNWTKTTARRDKKNKSLGFGASYIRDLTVLILHSNIMAADDMAIGITSHSNGIIPLHANFSAVT